MYRYNTGNLNLIGQIKYLNDNNLNKLLDDYTNVTEKIDNHLNSGEDLVTLSKQRYTIVEEIQSIAKSLNETALFNCCRIILERR